MARKHNVAPRYIHFPELHYAQLISCKCGTWTFSNLYQDRYGNRSDHNRTEATIENLRKLKAEGVFLAQFVRNPARRAISGYEFFKRLYKRRREQNIHFPESPEMRTWHGDRNSDFSFDEWLIASRDYFPLNKHVHPQWGVHEGLADMVWPLEDSHTGWRHIRQAIGENDLPVELPVDNPTVKLQERYFTSQKVINTFEDIYHKDIEWYQHVCNLAKFRPARSAARDL